MSELSMWGEEVGTGEAEPAVRATFSAEKDPYENLSLPERYGSPSCTHCHGRGRLPVQTPEGYIGPPALRLCRCVLVKDIVANVERAMPGLSKAQRILRSPLLGRDTQDLRVIADVEWFKANMRHVALRKSPYWDFRIVTDAELLQAWLATAAAKGMEIFDPDARRDMETRSLRYMTLADLAGSATLLVIRLGVKTAPNKEMPNVLLETILSRQHDGLRTWLWEQPNNRLANGHRCWSEFVEEEVAAWDSVFGHDAELEALNTKIEKRVESVPKKKSKPTPQLVLDAVQPTITDDGVYDSSSALLRAMSEPETSRKFNKKGWR